MTVRRPRLAALITAAAVVASVLLAAPAQAMTFDGEPTRTTTHFTVAGARYTLKDFSYGTATRTIHVGRTSGQVPVHYRLTILDAHGRVVARVHRGLEQQQVILERFMDARFRTRTAFEAAKHRASTVSKQRADAHWAHIIRIESVSSDLESSIGATLDVIDALPAGAKPDFSAVKTVKSFEYPGTATVSGNDTTSWTVTVRDTRDGYGIVYDAATGSEGVIRF
jgi:hypothetical protein